MASTMNHIVRSEVTETAFGFYSEEEIGDMSYCKIVSPLTHDALGNALQGGLYDVHMGPTDQNAPNCVTCGSIYMNCPGHPGHIELGVPVYHPLLFPNLFALLRTKCSYCHRFRIAQARARYTLIKLKLLEMGEGESVEKFDEMTTLPTKESIVTSGDDSSINIVAHMKAFEEDLERNLQAIEARYEFFLCKQQKFNIQTDNKVKQLQRELIDSFHKLAIATKKCENCGAFSPSLRKDGYSKIFQRPLQKRLERTMNAMRMRLKTGLETIQNIPHGLDVDNDSHGEMNVSDDGMDSASDSDDDESPVTANTADTDKYLVPLEVEAQMKLLWLSSSQPLLSYIWRRAMNAVGKDNKRYHREEYRLFFCRSIVVPPNRFRPPSVLGDVTSEHPQNQQLSKILSLNEKIANMNNGSQLPKPTGSNNTANSFTQVISAWIELQNTVNCYMDSAKDPNPLGGNSAPPGIRQLLERKEGLFRHHMMGKRVNYCCRSVISPDPYIGTDEIGIPLRFAKILQYPTPVTSWNVKHLRRLVENGPHEYPGANIIEMPDGKMIKLDKFTKPERIARARLLTSQPGIKVYRHLVSGDALLVNRQPTLHKPGIMAHKARILPHMKEQTLRMNYANCNTYNADFDGDEMNCHFVQSELARAECYDICNTSNQYIAPTSGNPLRGLIQDHVASAVKLTCKNTFLTRNEMQQLLFCGVCGLPGTELVPYAEAMLTNLPPAVFKPVPMWTGKQVITALLAHLIRPPLPKLHLDGKTRTPATALGAEHNEHVVIFRHGELLSGVMDKAAIGSSSFGIVHSVFELYGSEMASKLLTAFGRLFTYYLQDAGATCGIEDLTLNLKADAERRKLLLKVKEDTAKGVVGYTEGQENLNELINKRSTNVSAVEKMVAEARLETIISSDRVNEKMRLDATMQSIINKSASDILKACLPSGLERGFLSNNFSMMVMTGAKGSGVNQSQISCFLGQQALEGQRVPVMISGKSLPSFKAYDSSPRAGGFVQDRFLTGVKPQEYYFHCMAGREGLVDTAVKTSRSGYLQRCLVKHLEELKVNYDMTVRDSANNVVQFLYGEDGVDPTGAAYLGGKTNQMLFLARNSKAYAQKYEMDECMKKGLESVSASDYHGRLESIKSLLASMDIKSNQAVDANSENEHKLSELKKGNFIQLRRKKSAAVGWNRENICITEWEMGEIVKIRGKHDGYVGVPRFDIKYCRTGKVEKKVPLFLAIPARISVGGVAEGSCVSGGIFKLPIIQISMPKDTALSSLQLGTSVGAVSEKVQETIRDYIDTNPDGLVSSKCKSQTGISVTPRDLEMLGWVKYMKSLANPGEAVGCVAAQSVGEPSTQMTLNTFHLAGHGGANVTLGIPRLREIIMTASKNLKTPTMHLPLHKDRALDEAKLMARQISRLSLNILLDHMCGVEVGENIVKRLGSYERHYRIRFYLQGIKRIEKSFGVGFRDITDTIKGPLLKQLCYLIQLEKRRVGEKKSTGKQLIESRKSESVSRSEKNEDDSDGPNGVKKGKSNMKKFLEGDDSDVEEGDGGNADEGDAVSSKMSRKGKEQDGYDEPEEDEEEQEDEEDNGSDGERPANKTRSKSVVKSKQSNDVADMDEETDSDVDEEEEEEVKETRDKNKIKSKYNIVSDGVKSNVKEGWVEFVMAYPASDRRLLMAQLAELATCRTTVRATRGVTNAFGIEVDKSDGGGVALQVEGINFEAMWLLSPSIVNHNSLKSNDIYHILQTYGVEAARQSIVSEIIGVFGVYGIDVNMRHLNLIADFMTRTGAYIPMNRSGMMECPSPYVQMSFETTCGFLNKAAQEGLVDNMESASSRIVLGSVPKVGTGCFDLMVPLRTEI